MGLCVYNAKGEKGIKENLGAVRNTLSISKKTIFVTEGTGRERMKRRGGDERGRHRL